MSQRQEERREQDQRDLTDRLRSKAQPLRDRINELEDEIARLEAEIHDIYSPHEDFLTRL